MLLSDIWDKIIQGLITFGHVLFFSMPPDDDPPQGQSNHHLLVLMKSIEYQIQERIAAFPISEDTLLDWNMALMLNAARRTDIVLTVGEIWFDEDGNPIPYNDGIVAEYPMM